MYSVFLVLFLITGQLLLTTNGVLGSQFFGSGKRIDGDQLLLKDVQHSRPASDPPRVIFTYNIEEPITYIEIVSEENISARVQFSYTNSLVVGMVSLLNVNDSVTNTNPDVEFEEEILSSEFDVVIKIFGFNDKRIHFNPAQLLNRDSHFEGLMQPFNDSEEKFEMFKEEYVEPTSKADFESKDKIIEIGNRQEGDDLIYDIYQTSPDIAQGMSEHTLVFYYIDSDYITYVKFVIFDHFLNKLSTAVEYQAPVAEYSHYSPGTLKAAITDFNVTSMFVQMFVYGYRGRDAAPPDYKPFLPPPHWHRNPNQDVTTPSLTDFQMTLIKNGLSTQSPDNEDTSADNASDDDDQEQSLRPEDMIPDHVPEARSVANGALPNQEAMGQRLYAMLGLMLFVVA